MPSFFAFVVARAALDHVPGTALLQYLGRVYRLRRFGLATLVTALLSFSLLTALVTTAVAVPSWWLYSLGIFSSFAGVLSSLVHPDDRWVMVLVGSLSLGLGWAGLRLGRATGTQRAAFFAIVVMTRFSAALVTGSYLLAHRALVEFWSPYRSVPVELELKLVGGQQMARYSGEGSKRAFWRAPLCPGENFCCFPVHVYFSATGELLVFDREELQRLEDLAARRAQERGR
jgi:hypothetical protein